MTEQNPVVRRYLEQFEAGLKSIDAAERREIVREIESHIAEAVSAGTAVADVLVRLGAAERLARAYTAEALLSGPGRSLRKSLSAAWVLAASSAASLLLIPFLGITGMAFTLGGVLGLAGNIAYLALGRPVQWLGFTHLPFWPVQTALWLGIPISLIVVLLGVGALSLLKRYMLFMIRTVRRTIG